MKTLGTTAGTRAHLPLLLLPTPSLDHHTPHVDVSRQSSKRTPSGESVALGDVSIRPQDAGKGVVCAVVYREIPKDVSEKTIHVRLPVRISSRHDTA